MVRIDLSELDAATPIEDAAAGLRRLTELLLRVDEDDPALIVLVVELDRLGELLERSSGTPEFFDPQEYFDPLCGRANPLAPPLDIEVAADGGVSATGSLGLPYQGPRGLVHGGMSALMLDHVLRLTHPQGSSADVIEELSVRYHQPLPLFEDLVVIGRQRAPDGQRIGAHGEITVDGRLAVSAEALFRDATPPTT